MLTKNTLLRFGVDTLNRFSAKDCCRFSGRTVAVGEKVYFNWSGSGFEFEFEGTFAAAEFLTDDLPNENERTYIGVYVDGCAYLQARFPIDKTSGIYTLAENLPYGKHTVKVIRDTEMWYGKVAVTDILTENPPEAPRYQPKMKIEFIGDSITCGYGSICSNASPEFLTSEESFAETYASKAAKMLGADISVIAASGSGFYHDYGCSTKNLIPELYLYRDKLLGGVRGEEPQKHDFENDPCDVVVIKLGQNDGQYCRGADLPEGEFTPETDKQRRLEFTKAASEFFAAIKRLRKNAPVILIFESDMLLKNEVKSAAKSVYPDIELLEIMPKRPYEGVGANGHYSVYTHTRLAGLLCERIKRIC